MSDKQIDTLVAEKVMGGEIVDEDLHIVHRGKTMGVRVIRPDWAPSTKIADAWTVVERLSTQHMLTIRIGGKMPKGPTYHTYETMVTIEGEFTRAESPARAICLAALKAIGYEDEHRL